MSPLDPDLLDAVAAAVLVADSAGRIVVLTPAPRRS